MKSLLIYSLSLMILFLSACSTDKIPGVYRIDIQQGNNVSQEMVDKLKPGMTKNQVAYVMGTPLIIDTFHDERWDYVYSFHPGNGVREQRRITLFFDQDEKLSHIEGNITTNSRTAAQEDVQDTNVVVPLQEKKTGLFQGLLNSIGLGDDDEVVIDDRDAEVSEEPVQQDEMAQPVDEEL